MNNDIKMPGFVDLTIKNLKKSCFIEKNNYESAFKIIEIHKIGNISILELEDCSSNIKVFQGYVFNFNIGILFTDLNFALITCIVFELFETIDKSNILGAVQVKKLLSFWKDHNMNWITQAKLAIETNTEVDRSMGTDPGYHDPLIKVLIKGDFIATKNHPNRPHAKVVESHKIGHLTILELDNFYVNESRFEPKVFQGYLFDFNIGILFKTLNEALLASIAFEMIETIQEAAVHDKYTNKLVSFWEKYGTNWKNQTERKKFLSFEEFTRLIQ